MRITVGILTSLIACSASAAPGYCGNGPHEIRFYQPAYCNGVTPKCDVYGNKEDGYRKRCAPDPQCVAEAKVEKWTDYPECDGKQIVGKDSDTTWHATTDQILIWSQ